MSAAAVVVAWSLAAPARAGDIKGHIVWGEDQIPEMPVLNVDKDQKCCLAKGPVHSEDWVINPKNKGIRWTFVWLAPVPPAKKMPVPEGARKTKPAVLDQPLCMFVPHALVLEEGQKLIVKNSAEVAHNVHYIGYPLKNPGGNKLIPKGQKIVIDDLQADTHPIKVTCDIHGWMSAWIRVFDHPYYALTDADGKFTIKNAPAGAYRLMIWHPSVGWRGGAKGRNGMEITIKANGDTDVGKLDLKSKYEE
jgi:hypothetical protein